MEIDRLKPGDFGLVWERTGCVWWRDNTPFERQQTRGIIAHNRYRSKNRVVGIVRLKRWKDTEKNA